jgi:hypothetical protein
MKRKVPQHKRVANLQVLAVGRKATFTGNCLFTLCKLDVCLTANVNHRN